MKPFKLLLFCVVFFCSCSAFAEDGLEYINSDNVIVISHLADGYIEIRIPFYTSNGAPEAILRGSYMDVDGKRCLNFRSSNKDGDPDTWQVIPYYGCYRIWAKRSTEGAVKVFTLGAQPHSFINFTNEYSYYYGDEREVSANEYEGRFFEIVEGRSYAIFKVYLNESLLGKSVNYMLHFNPDEDSDGAGSTDHDFDCIGSLAGVEYTVPNLNSSISGTSGKYDVDFTVSSAKSNSKFIWDVDDRESATVFYGNTATSEFDIADTCQHHKLYLFHKVSDYQYYKVEREITLPAFPQATNFMATQLPDCNTSISWSVNTLNLGDNPVTGDQFEIQRDDNANFTNPKSVAKVDYDVSKGNYSVIDETSEENLNGTYYYRIRRTKTQNEWGWEVSGTTSVDLQMAHKNIASASAKLEGNISRITWEYDDDDNVWTDGSTVVLERYNITNGGIKETITIPKDSLDGKSYSDELFQTCNRFSYKIYVKPGSTSYPTEDALTVQGEVVPLESGQLLSVNASKGYFPDRVELSWDTDGLPINYFIVKSRIYESGNAFKQTMQVTAADGSELYQAADEQANPGTIYEYQIIGVVNCADVTVYTDTLYTYGFRTPSGDIYGRVTFENGQAEEKVEVRLERDEGEWGKSLAFTGTQYATINDTAFLKNNPDSLTVQAWIAPDNFTGILKIFSKPGMYELGINEGNLYFAVGTQTVTSAIPISNSLAGANFVHVSGVYSGDSVFIYTNGERTDSISISENVIGNANQATLGDGFDGAIDEVRVWGRPLSKEEILRDYNRYITGGEKGMLAYWSFNYITSTEFFDCSYHNSTYNENHGLLNGIVADENRIPTNEQLGYRGVTGKDGSYSIRSIPYFGNGTVYSIIPRLGIHQFEPEQEVRFLGEGSESFTVNFTDKSSFKVTGTVTYDGGTVPVEGVFFYIDGVVAMDGKGNVLMSDARGEFEISVPVGSHEVIARKTNHEFKNEGKITGSDGLDLNYQDEVLGVELSDITKVRYIGRVAGGAEQDAYILGHSLSTNNLADGITVTLTTKNPAYSIANEDTTITYEHFIPSNKSVSDWPKSNTVDYGKGSITIYPNVETGEFIADVIPEAYTVTVNVPGHEDIPGSGQDLNLSQYLVPTTIVNEYTDSTLVNGDFVKVNYSDTVYYNHSQKFIKRYAPTIRISQLDNRKRELAYYGDLDYSTSSLDGTETALQLYNTLTKRYTLRYPVFKQNSNYSYKAEVFEQYQYYGANGSVKKGVEADEVPTSDAVVEFTNNLAITSLTQVEADSTGVAYYDFQVTEPELTSGLRKFSAKIYYGSEEPQTSISWNGAFDGIILGGIQTGRDFVTGGPDKVLMVLRDPPGTNSYSYLEKGITVSESSTYNGSAKNKGSELFTQYLGFDLVTWVGFGGGVINTVENKNGITLGVVHEETVSGSESKKSVTTTTTRFETSSDPMYVGADGDVFVGYSTNIAYGATNNVNIVTAEQYQDDPSKYEVFETITPSATSSYLLVKQVGLGVAQTFGTLFAYPQKHIEDRLLPEMEALRNNFLMQLPSNMTYDDLQELATELDTTFYVSYLSSGDPNYGKDNDDSAFRNTEDPDPKDEFNGPSYRVIFPDNDDYTRHDTVLYLNQSIANWYKQLENNEKAKLNAKLLQNYSFQGGSPISYSESYSESKSSTTSFDVMIGANFKTDVGVKVLGSGFKLQIDETLSTTHGGVFEDSETEQHCKGFVLSETKNDYISVDVMHENADLDVGNGDSHDNFYPTFIFRSQAGATSCPYEDGYITNYYEPGKHVIDQATKKIEVPEIAVEDDFIENVPSGSNARFTLYLRNNSEIQQDNFFDLKLVNESNPNGARFYIDGAPIGNGLEFLVPAGGTLVKTLEVGKGAALNYDNLKLVLESQCERNINDTLNFSVHFIPSCSQVSLAKPGNNWTYNTKLATYEEDGVAKHYMNVNIDEFDINYDSFNSIKLQYKSTSDSDEQWKTLMNYYADSVLYKKAIADGWNAEMIDAADAGTITYRLELDDLPDQLYDVRAATVCVINNEEIYNYSDVVTGIKDMYCPRLFGNPQPANGILTIEDDIRLNFNEQIADGLLTKNNFQVKGIRNGAQTDHSVSIHFDGINDYMATEFEKNQTGKDITVEMWIKSDEPQDADLFVHGNINESIGMGLTADNHLKVWLGGNEIYSNEAVPFEAGSWAHVSFVYSADGSISANYNFNEVIGNVNVGPYAGIGNFVLGSNITSSENFFNGNMHNVRVWNTERTSGELQVNSLKKLSGNEPGLLAYYPMTDARGDFAEDNARGANMLMNECSWTTPEGRAVALNGTDSYVKLTTGSSAVITSDMDYTIELWFKGEPGQTNATLFSNGRGDGQDNAVSAELFSIGFNESGKLAFSNNGFTSTVDGDYLDNNWHHLAINVGRTIGRGQIYVDGELMTYFSVDELGGIASAYMYIGARGWYKQNESATLLLDNYFNGQVDEVRIWNLYKYEQQIQNYNNVKLDGTEMGLLAYYPFEYYKEWQGLEELDFTLADMKIQDDLANAVPDAESFNSEQVSDIPPVKDKGPVSDLEFDFVVNNDALIIYLEETSEKVEKTIVTFTVDGVQDINGNENISPITWSAYIDRNMLKWGEMSMNISKPLDEAVTFTVQAVNKGGAIENYSIQNLPSWMKASPVSGTIEPNSSVDITFTIDEGLNVGTYNENIYLTNSDNVSEVLEVNVAAKGDTPDWSVNPADFEYSMQVYAKLRINNLFSSDPEDMIAAFSGGKCVGVAHVQYEQRNDMWYAFLIVYSNETVTDNLVFKIWDASTGTVYLGDAGRTIGFTNNTTIGSPVSPAIFDAGNLVYQNIDIEPGWNWISVNLNAPAMNDLNEFLADMNWTSGDFFKSEVDNVSANYSEQQQHWITENSLSLRNELMYKVSSGQSQSIPVSGSKITPSENPLQINGGQWNYIGYLPVVRLPIDEALAGYDSNDEDVIKSQDEFAMYAGNIGWVGSLTYLQPGEGYMLYRTNSSNAMLTYPDDEGSLSTKSAMPMVAEFVNHDYAQNMNLVAVSDVKPKRGDRILAYSGNELNAEISLRYVNSNLLYFITIPGANKQDVWFELERDGRIIGRTDKVFSFTANAITGTVVEPFLLKFSGNNDLLTAYPNPTGGEVVLTLSTDKTGPVDIRIIDISGRTIYAGKGGHVVGGQSRTVVNCSDFQPGMYFAIVTVEGSTKVIKIEKQ